MRKNSAPAADPKARVGELQRRTQDARKRAQAAKKEARDAKQRAREARRLFKEAKKVAKKARTELAALSKKLKKLIDSAPGAHIKDHEAGTPEKKKPATGTVAKSKKSTRKVAQPKQAKATQGKKKVSKSKGKQPPRPKASTLVESGAAESQAPTPRRSRSTRRSVTNGSIEAVVDATRPGDAPARTSEETVVEPERQNTPEESAA